MRFPVIRQARACPRAKARAMDDDWGEGEGGGRREVTRPSQLQGTINVYQNIL